MQAVIDLSRAAGSVGDNCEVATIVDQSASRSRARGRSGSVVFHEFAPSWPARLGNSWSLIKWLVRNARDFDLVEIHEVFTAAALLTATVARWKRVPFIVRPHGSLDPFDLRQHRAAKALLSPVFGYALLRPAGALCFTSSEELRRSRVFGSKAPRYSIPLPVHVTANPGRRAEFRQGIGVEPETFVVLFLSRINYKKGLERTLEAVATVHASGAPIVLVIAGDGEAQYVSHIQRRMDQLGIHTLVRFIGFVTGQAKADAFAGADAFVLCSDNENFGMTIIEALAAGTPVVISNRVYLAAELKARGAALVIEPTAAALHTALEELIVDSSVGTGLSTKGRHVVSELFDSSVIARREQEMRERILVGQRQGRRGD